MSAESKIYSILAAAPAVVALVGQRIYPDLIPERVTLPYIGFERVGTDPIRTMHGTILADDCQMVVACWAATRTAAEALADAVAAAMQSAGELYDARGGELDEATGRLAATLDYSILIQH